MTDATGSAPNTEEQLDDGSRRRFLTIATAVVGGAGVAAAATPFVTYFRPSARALFLGAPVQVDVSKIELGSLLRVEWRGQPVYIVGKGVCTHLGCAPQYLPSVTATEVAQPWFGGFFCPCHGSKFDLAGRVFKGVPAQRNLDVPPYQFLDNDVLIIGEDGGSAA